MKIMGNSQSIGKSCGFFFATEKVSHVSMDLSTKQLRSTIQLGCEWVKSTWHSAFTSQTCWQHGGHVSMCMAFWGLLGVG
jgi:hypothetical protein